MLKFVALALSCASVQALACPNLVGTYNCAYQDGSSEVISITQVNRNGVTVFIYNGSEIPADNQAHPIDAQSASSMWTTVKHATFRAWCDLANPNLLHSQLIGQYWEADRAAEIDASVCMRSCTGCCSPIPYESATTATATYFGDITVNNTFAMVGQDLKQTAHGTLRNASGEYPFNSEIVCARK